MERLGLTRERLLDAIFTGDTLPRLLQHWRDKPGAIDQSNLARFLATILSSETCRKIVVALARAGFLKREKTAFGTVLVSSSGRLEKLFGDGLRRARERFENGPSHEP